MYYFLLLMTLVVMSCNGRSRREGREARDVTSAFEQPPQTRGSRPPRTLTFAFYNLENLFDTDDDPATNDDDFTPSGRNHWTPERLDRKLENIARAVMAMNDGRGPDVLGVCEAENRRVLEMLVRDHLRPDEYRIVHADSRDERGIDVALLYRASLVKPLRTTMHLVNLGPGERPTRDVMEVTLGLDSMRFTVLVNHWPSRNGGEAGSSWKRERAAATAARVIDSLRQIDPAADIVLMGDLNDTPLDRSVREVLDADGYDAIHATEHRLINTATPIAREGRIGSYYYKNEWEVLDQIMVSVGALNQRGLSLYETNETIFAPSFLRDSRADPVDLPPYRSYKGPFRYIGGTSDHFPVLLTVGIGRE